MRRLLACDGGVVVDALYELSVSSPNYAHLAHTDEDYVKDRITYATTQPNFIGFIDEAFKGFMLSGLSSTWYSPQVDCHEQLLYVFPEHRGTSMAPRLIRATEEAARDLGAVNMIAGVSTGIDDDRVEALYRRLGYTQLGHTLTKRLQPSV